MVLLGDLNSVVSFLMMAALFIVSLFLILLVLVQRGKGGGLTGALGGMGGQSAFGTKAGDVFTRLTIGTAIVWILLCLITIQFIVPRPPPAEDSAGIRAPGAGMMTDTDTDEDGVTEDGVTEDGVTDDADANDMSAEDPDQQQGTAGENSNGGNSGDDATTTDTGTADKTAKDGGDDSDSESR